MNKKIIFIFFFLCVLIIACGSSRTENSNNPVRLPAVNGGFYPADPKELTNMINDFLKDIPLNKDNSHIYGIIVPHAGYVYSGKVAAHAFKQLINNHYDTIIVLGVGHRYPIYNPSIETNGIYRTPLGDIPIDKELAIQIQKNYPEAKYIPEASTLEHSIEVELPFLQIVLKNNFKIVPILMGRFDLDIVNKMANAIYEAIKDKKNILIIASSDLSHYPDYKNAQIVDKETINLIQNAKVKELIDREENVNSSKVPNLVTYQCGCGAICTLLNITKKIQNSEIELLDNKNSGDVSWIKERVVGYSAMVITSKNINNESSDFTLTKEEQQFLLKIARETLDGYVKNHKIPKFDIPYEKLKQNAGAFVTLNINHELRGCIGYIEPIKPLYQTVIDNAINSSTKDYRFSPVSTDELKDITIEISVLTPPVPVASYKDIKIGTHGMILKKGFNQAVFLPQVAPEQGWDLATTLTHLSMKAGLGPNDWKQGAEFEVFTAIVFHETK